MLSVAVKLYSLLCKFLLKHRLQNRIQASFGETKDPFGVSSRPGESMAAANPSFTDGVATEDIHIDPLTSLSIRIFLPDTCLRSLDSDPRSLSRARVRDVKSRSDPNFGSSPKNPNQALTPRNPRKCVLGVSCGANLADYVAQKAVEGGKLLDPVREVAQVLMYRFFIGSVPTHSEIKLANSYFYDKAMCIPRGHAIFLPEEDFSLDHPAANPLVPGRGPPLMLMPPSLTHHSRA